MLGRGRSLEGPKWLLAGSRTPQSFCRGETLGGVSSIFVCGGLQKWPENKGLLLNLSLEALTLVKVLPVLPGLGRVFRLYFCFLIWCRCRCAFSAPQSEVMTMTNVSQGNALLYLLQGLLGISTI